jgi:hypothetical protein
MMTPEWIEDRVGWETSQTFYKRMLFRLIIDPAETICMWWSYRVGARWYAFKNRIMKIKKGYDYSDVWNMNDWFIENAVAILETWLAHPNQPSGSPCTDDETGKEMTYEKWVSILNEMLEGFKLYKVFEMDGGIVQEPHDVYDTGTYRTGKSFFDKGGQYKSCHVDGAHYMTFDGVWNKMSMTKTEYAKYEKALALFAKYHGGLWD